MFSPTSDRHAQNFRNVRILIVFYYFCLIFWKNSHQSELSFRYDLNTSLEVSFCPTASALSLRKTKLKVHLRADGGGGRQWETKDGDDGSNQVGVKEHKKKERKMLALIRIIEERHFPVFAQESNEFANTKKVTKLS